MHKLMIYLQSDSHYLQKTDRGYGCLVVKPDGSRWKAAGYGETTWHQAELIALRGALTRLDDNYEVHIFSEDTFVLGNFTNGNVEHWREKGFRRNDGKEIANACLWREISQKTRCQKVVTHVGSHDEAKYLMHLIAKTKAKMKQNAAAYGN